MYYHASQTPGIQVLTPHISNHGKPLVYLSEKRENVLVYLSNAIEKHCKSVGFNYHGIYRTWGSYGFTKDGILELSEYYPNAAIDTYKGVSGYIYSTATLAAYQKQSDIPYAVITEIPVAVQHCEFIPDAYEAIMDAVKNHRIIFKSYEENSAAKLNWIKQTIISEYEQSEEHPDYQLFLKAKFDLLK